jgi:ATP-dependent helicase/nuclease subunit A
LPFDDEPEAIDAGAVGLAVDTPVETVRLKADTTTEAEQIARHVGPEADDTASGPNVRSVHLQADHAECVPPARSVRLQGNHAEREAPARSVHLQADHAECEPPARSVRLQADRTGVADVADDLPDAAARRAAVDPAQNIVLEASAGTGKTRVLVERYVNLLRAGVEPDHILAITFTRKAAAEMRQRIIERLREASRLSEFDAARWRDLRERLGDIAISTIDAFCLSLLREFPLEADVDPGFDLADGTQVPRLVGESLDQALRICRGIAAEDDDVALVFAQLGERRLRGGISALLDRRLVAPHVLRRYLSRGPKDLTAAVACRRAADRLRDLLAPVRGGLDAFLNDGPVRHPQFAMLASDLRQLCSDLSQETRRSTSSPNLLISCDPRDRRDTLESREQLAGFRALVDRLRAYFLKQDGDPRGKNFTGTGFNADDCRTDDAWKRHRQIASDLAPAVADAIRGFRRDLNVVMSRGVWRIFAIALGQYERTLESHALLDFSGVLDRAVKLLRDLDEFAESRLRLEARHRHVLVDEFQDTSRAQWELVLQLVKSWGEGFGAAADAIAPSIFVVGDRKQSIYGFRDADVTVVDDAAMLIEGLRPDGHPRHAITVSFRSAPEILALVNDLFATVVACSPETQARADAFRYDARDRFPTDQVRLKADTTAETAVDARGVRVPADQPDARDVRVPADQPDARGVRVQADQPDARSVRLQADQPDARDVRVQADQPDARGVRVQADRPDARSVRLQADRVDQPLSLIAAETVQLTAERVADEVVALLSGALVRDRTTGLRREATPADIAILFRSRDSHRDFEAALERRGVATYVYKGLGFFESDEVQDAVALLRYLADPTSDLRASALLRSRIVRLSDGAVAALGPRVANAILDADAVLPDLDDEDRRVLAVLRSAVPGWLARVDRQTPSEILDAILRETAYAFELVGSRRRQARENLKKLRAMVRRAQNRGYATLARIADHFEQLAVGDESNAAIDAVDAVSLMTVHAAKGLEFPIVFVVNMGRGTGGIRPAIRVSETAGDASVAIADYQSEADEDASAREREETKRLLYVALTRARDRLYLSAAVQDGKCKTGRGSLGEVLPDELKRLFVSASAGEEPSWVGPSGVRHAFVVPAAAATPQRLATATAATSIVDDFARVER